MGDKSFSNTFMSKLAGFSIGPVISAVIGFLTVPLTTWLIDPSMFGKASMFVTFQSLISLILFLGFDQAFVREYREVKNRNNLLFNSILFPVIFSVVISLLVFIERRNISLILFSDSDILSMNILALSIPVLIYKRFGLLLIRMDERGKLYSLLQILEKLVYLIILIPVFIFWEKTYRSIIIANFLMVVSITVLELIITRRKWISDNKIDKILIKKMMHFGLPLIPVGVLVWIMNSMDKVFLRIWSDYNEIGLYAGAFKIVLVMDIIKRSFSNFWIPVSYRWYKERVSIKKYETVNINLSAVLTLLFTLVVISRKIIILILDPAYHKAYVLVPFLLFVPMMYTLSETTVLGIAFSRKTVYNLYITLTIAVINLIGNYFLVPEFGALGAAIATGFSYIIFFILRSLVGNRLWEGISLTRGFINLLLLIVLSGVTLLDIYYIEFFILILVIVINFKEYKYLYRTIISFMSKRNGV